MKIDQLNDYQLKSLFDSLDNFIIYKGEITKYKIDMKLISYNLELLPKFDYINSYSIFIELLCYDNPYVELYGKQGWLDIIYSDFDKIHSKELHNIYIPLMLKGSKEYFKLQFKLIDENNYYLFITKSNDLSLSQEKLFKHSYYDELTGLLNRNSMKMHIKSTYNNCDFLNIVIIDVDNFKSINDNFGHIIGDKVLDKIGLAINKLLDIYNHSTFKSIRAYRMGGDEFLLTFIDLKEEEVKDILKILTENISSIKIEEHNVSLKFSYGINKLNPKKENIELVLKNADILMYSQKKNKDKSIYN